MILTGYLRISKNRIYARLNNLQSFDRKSARIAPKVLAIPVVAFANADGGIIVIGIKNDGKITGIDEF